MGETVEPIIQLPATGEIHFWLDPTPAGNEREVSNNYLRDILSNYLPQNQLQARLQRDPRGKPRLNPNPQQLGFNLSHCHKLIGCVVAVGCEPGFDIEYLRRSNDYLAIARRYFSADEYARIDEVDGPGQKNLFFRYWTLKEALLKASGRGLAGGLASTGLTIDDALHTDWPEPWLLLQWPTAGDYLCSLALIRPPGITKWQLRTMTPAAADFTGTLLSSLPHAELPTIIGANGQPLP